MKRDQVRLRLLTDPRLSDSARVLGLYVESLGEGAHEIDRAEFRRVLYGTPSKDRVARALAELEVHGWVKRAVGGRGHHDSFAFSVAESPTVSDSVRETATVSADSVAESPTLKAPVVVEGGDVVVTPPVVPPLDDQADRAVTENEAALAGCRGALRDYLAQRVPPHRQSAFVWSAVGWLSANGFTWRTDRGDVVPQPDRPGLLANALNQLLASDESAYKAPVGDPRNVLTKLGHVCRAHGERANGNGNGRPAGTATGGGGITRPAATAGAQRSGRVFNSE